MKKRDAKTKRESVKHQHGAADLDAGAVGEEGLWALGVVERPVAHAAPRRSDGEVAAVEQVAGPVAVLGRFVDDLKGHNHTRY